MLNGKKIIIAIFLCTAFSACSKPAFTVQPLQASNIVMNTDSSDPSVTKQMQFTVQACMSDAASSGHYSVASTAFTLTKDGTTNSIQSDQKGCLYWQENLSFNWLDPEHYVKFSRTIVGKGNFGGTQNVNFAMDPWKNSTSGFVDMNVTPLDDSTLEIKKDSITQTDPVFVRTVAVHTYNAQTTKDGTTVQTELTLNPYYTRTGLSGTALREPINQGHFKIELFLLEQNKNGNASDTVLLAHENDAADAQDGVITLLTQLHLSRVPKQDSQIVMAFRLSFDLPAKEITQESMLVMDQLITQSSLTVQPVNQSLDAYSSSATSASASPTSSPSANSPSSGGSSGTSSTSTHSSVTSNSAGFRIDNLDIEQGAVTGTYASTNMSKSVSARINVCLKDSLSLKNIVDHDFQVGLATDPTKTPALTSVTSDSSGCIHWQTEIDFNGYAQDQWYPYSLIIHSKSAPYIDNQQAMVVNIDPYNSGSGFFWDSRNGNPPSKTADANVSAKDSTNAKLSVTEISYAFTGRDFELDHSMNLVMNRHYQVRFSPTVAYQKSYNSEVDSIPIKNGRLSFKLMVMSGDNPLSLYSGSAPVVDGEVVADVTLPFEIARFPEVINRNQLLLEVSDSDPSSNLRSETLSTEFTAVSATGGAGLEESKESIDTITGKLNTYAAGASIGKNMKVFAEQKITENDLAKMGFANGNEVQGFISANGMDDAKAARFCEVMYSSITEIAACQKSPKDHLQFAAKKPDDGVMGTTSEVSTNVFMLNGSATVSFSTSNSLSQNQGYSSGTSLSTSARVNGNVSLGTGIEIFGNGPKINGGVGADAGIGHTWSWYTGQSADIAQRDSQDNSIARTYSLVVEQMDIQAITDPGLCLSVSRKTSDNTGSAYFCSSPQTGDKVNETWYFVHPQYSSATMVDSNELGPMSFTAVIRGSSNFDNFKQIFQNKNKTIVLTKHIVPPQSLTQVAARKLGVNTTGNSLIDKLLSHF